MEMRLYIAMEQVPYEGEIASFIRSGINGNVSQLFDFCHTS